MKTLKTIVTTILCLALILGSFTTLSVSAADEISWPALKVTFDGESVNLHKKDGSTCAIKTLKKKWGKPKTTKYTNQNEYTWTKGESTITITDEMMDIPAKQKHVQGVTISINDKNASVLGITVGMSKAKAVKKLKKALGKENISVNKDPNEGYTYISAQYGGYFPINFYLENGKVSKIAWWHS